MIATSLVVHATGVGDPGSRLHLEAPIVSDVIPEPEALYLEAAIDGSAGEMATSHSVQLQRFGWRLTVDGDVLDMTRVVDVSVEMDIDNPLRTWSFEVALDTPDGLWDNPIMEPGPGLCKREVDIDLVLPTTTGFYYKRLITGGVCDSESRTSLPNARARFSGVCSGGRYDGELVDLVLPPGHGLSRPRVIEIAARRAGVTDVDLHQVTYGNLVWFQNEDGTWAWASYTPKMMKEFQMSDAQFLGPCQELADVDQMRLYWDSDGFLKWTPCGPPADEEDTIDHFDERNFKRAAVTIEIPGGETVTEVTVNGEEQLIRDPEDCGDVTTSVEVTSEGLQGPIAPKYAQSTGGYATNPYDTVEFDDPQRVRLEVLERTVRCGIEVYTRRMSYSYFLPMAARYTWDAVNDEWDRIDGIYADEGTDGNANAYVAPIEKWLLTEVDEEWHYWNDEEFLGPRVGPVASQEANFGVAPGYAPQLVDLDFSKVKIGTFSVSWRWYAVKKYLKTRTLTPFPPPIWEEVEPPALHAVYGDKSGCAGLVIAPAWLHSNYQGYQTYSSNDGELFLPVSATTVLYESDGRGYLIGEERQNFGWLARPNGSAYLYGDGKESDDEQEEFRLVSTETKKYSAAGENNHDEIVVRSDFNGRDVSSQTTTGLDGYLPAIDRIPDGGTIDTEEEEDVYEDEAEQAAVAAETLRTEVRPFAVTIRDADLEHCHVRNVVELAAPYAENEAEADRMARHVIARSAAPRFSAELARVHPWLRPGLVSEITCHPLGITQAMRSRITKVAFNGRMDRGVLRTYQTMNAEIYGIAVPE